MVVVSSVMLFSVLLPVVVLLITITSATVPSWFSVFGLDLCGVIGERTDSKDVATIFGGLSGPVGVGGSSMPLPFV